MEDEKIIKILLGHLEYMLDNTDEDGYCEHGCSCGECDNCLELADIQSDFSSIKKMVEG